MESLDFLSIESEAFIFWRFVAFVTSWFLYNDKKKKKLLE